MNPPADVDAILDVGRLPRPRITAKADGRYQNTTPFVTCANGDDLVRRATDWVGERV